LCRIDVQDRIGNCVIDRLPEFIFGAVSPAVLRYGQLKRACGLKRVGVDIPVLIPRNVEQKTLQIVQRFVAQNVSQRQAN
jgi:hypothetical protein